MKAKEILGSGMEIFCGNAGERALLVRPVERADVPEVLKLQDYVVRCLPDRNLLVSETEEEILESIEEDLCIGVFDGRRIIAFSLMVVNRDTPRSLGQRLGYPPEKCVFYDITFVHPDYRGLGLQTYLLRRRDVIARALGAELAFVTVSPDNAHSLNNIIRHGFEIVDRRIMYTGVERYILKKQLV